MKGFFRRFFAIYEGFSLFYVLLRGINGAF